MKIKKYNIQAFPSPVGSYSHVSQIGSIVFVSASGSIDPKTGVILGKTIEEQTKVIFSNLNKLLLELGASFKDVVKIGVYLKNIKDFDGFDSVYREYFKEVGFPARTTIGCDLWNGLLIEIDAVVSVNEGMKED